MGEFKADIERYGCQNKRGLDAHALCAGTTNPTLATIYFWGVAVNPLVHKGWPVTDQDIAHILATPQFIDCGANPIPTLDVGAVLPPAISSFPIQPAHAILCPCLQTVF